MLVFLVLALFMVGGALLLLLPAFWGRYQLASSNVTEQNIRIAREKLTELKQHKNQKIISDDDYQQQRKELEQTLALELDEESQPEVSALGDKRVFHVLAIALLVPALAFLFYFSVGNPTVLFQSFEGKSLQASSETPETHQSMDQLVAGLEQRLRENPDDPDGWMMLGRTYMSLKRYEDAIQVFEKVITIMGEQAPVLVAMADAMIMARGGSVSGKPAELVQKALQQDPDNVNGLWLAGLAEEEQGNNRQAVRYWREAETLLNDDPASVTELRELIRRAESKLDNRDMAQDTLKTATTTGIRVNVMLDEKLSRNTSPDDTVFIYAQAPQGMRMPLAIVRKKVSELPVEVILNDEMAMMPGRALSNFSKVNLYARISKSSQAKAQSGDFIGSVQSVDTSSNHRVAIQINQEIP
ncbi:MAG: c-type cytochrome biogenesis protein CcmI [Gammaproteobacteria bacterium]